MNQMQKNLVEERFKRQKAEMYLDDISVALADFHGHQGRTDLHPPEGLAEEVRQLLRELEGLHPGRYG